MVLEPEGEVVVPIETLEALRDLAYSDHFKDFDSLEPELKAALVKIRHILAKYLPAKPGQQADKEDK